MPWSFPTKSSNIKQTKMRVKMKLKLKMKITKLTKVMNNKMKIRRMNLKKKLPRLIKTMK